MIKQLITSRSPLFWIILHFILGVLCVFSPFPLIVWFYLTLGTSIYLVLTPNTPISIYSSVIVYLVSMEILARMSGTSPYIPYEMGKYLFCLLLIIGIIKYKITSLPAIWMLILILPALLFDVSHSVTFLDIMFNFLGAFNVALAIILFKDKKLSFGMLKTNLRLIVYPMISVLAHALIKAPDINEIEFGLSANTVAAGGFGSNQVSTAMGLGAFLLFIFWLNRWRFSGYRWIDSLLLGMFLLEGLLTFSRGGMISGFIGIFVVLMFLRFATPFQIRKFRLVRIGKYFIPALILLLGSFFVVNILTDGMLLLRYQGETAGTLAGSKSKTLNTISSGRLDIFMGDLELWMDHPVFGAGVGASQFARDRMTGIVAHVEFSRLLGEHGLLGLIYFILLIYYGSKLPRSHPNPLVAGVITALFLVGLVTSFHAAMRTFVSPLLIGLSMFRITGSTIPGPVAAKTTNKNKLVTAI